MNIKILILACAATLPLAACNTSNNSPAARGYEMRVRYAQVTEVRREQQPSAVPAGAIVGGFTGLILSSGESSRRQVGSAVGGAVLGALATSALEGDRMAYAYTLRYMDGTTTRFVTEKGYLQAGDCVSVERGRYANIRRVPSSLCDARNRNAPVDDSIRLDAQACDDAKDQLLAASNQEQVDMAARKVEILCAY